MFQILKALLYPPKCIVCGEILDIPLEEAQHTYFCHICIRGILEEPQEFYCEEDKKLRSLIVKGVFPNIEHYQKSVLRWKYGGIRKYAKGYGQAMSLMDVPWEELDALIPVPISKKRYKKRGFNQALDLAQELTFYTKVPTYDLLERVRDTKPQSACTKEERKDNIRGSIGINRKNDSDFPSNLKNIAIIDDIYTTGSTVGECIKVLKAETQGTIEKIYVLVVNRGM